MQIPNPKSRDPNPKRVLALGFGMWFLGFGIYAPATGAAQGAYVAGAIGADITRVSHADSDLGSSPQSGAEVLSGGLRAGTSIGSTWGVEIDFSRTGRTTESGPDVNPLALTGTVPPITLSTGLQLPVGSIPIPVPFDFQSDTKTRHSSVDAVAWARKPAGAGVDLVFLGGVAFARDRSDLTETLTPIVRTLGPVQTFHTTLIDYATRPLVGMEARIKFTSRVRLIPGVRLQGLASGWLVRPYVGLGWFF